MKTSASYDFRSYDYSIDPETGRIQSTSKSRWKWRRSQSVIEAIQAILSSPSKLDTIPLRTLCSIQSFTRALNAHLEKREGRIGALMRSLQCGPVITLSQLEKTLHSLIQRKIGEIHLHDFQDLSQLEWLADTILMQPEEMPERQIGIQRLCAGIFLNKEGEDARWVTLFHTLLKLDPSEEYLARLETEQSSNRRMCVLQGELPTEALRAQAALCKHTIKESLPELTSLAESLRQVPKAMHSKQWFQQRLAQFANAVKNLFLVTPGKYSELITTIILLEGSLDWVIDFFVTEREKNDKALHLLNNTLIEAVKLPLFPATLREIVKNLIELFWQKEYVRVAASYIDTHNVDLAKLKSLKIALCYVKAASHESEWFKEGLRTFCKGFLSCLKSRIDDAEFRKMLPDLLKPLQFDTEKKWITDYFESLPSPMSVQLLEAHIPEVKRAAGHLSQLATLEKLQSSKELGDALLLLPPDFFALSRIKKALQSLEGMVKAAIFHPEWNDALPDTLFIYLQVAGRFPLEPDVAFEALETNDALLEKMARALDLLLARQNVDVRLLQKIVQWRSKIKLLCEYQPELKTLQALIQDTLPTASQELDKVLSRLAFTLHKPQLFKRGVKRLAEWFISLKETTHEAHHELLARILHFDHILRHNTVYSERDSMSIHYLYANAAKRFAHFSAIKSALVILPKETNLNAMQIIQLAAYIAFILPHMDRSYIKKNLDQALPRSLIQDKATGRVYIRLKGKSTLLNDGGTYKKVTAAIELSKEYQALAVAEATNREAAYSELHWEYSVYNRLGQTRGIWEKKFALEYTKQNSFDTIKKIACFFSLATGDLHHLQDTLSFEQTIEVASQLMSGLAALHAIKLVHNDIKKTNALAKIGPDGKVVAGLIDFGMAYGLGMKTTGNFDRGFYGSTAYTPPELFGVKKFQGDPFKLDVWAVGCILYSMHFKKQLPWNQITADYHGVTCTYPVTERAKKRFNTLVVHTIEEPLKALSCSTKEEKLSGLIYQCLRLDPKDRLDASQALKEISGLLSL